jgi:hypothetical protein
LSAAQQSRAGSPPCPRPSPNRRRGHAPRRHAPPTCNQSQAACRLTSPSR